MHHPLRGLLIGPLAAPVVYWIGFIVYATARGAPFTVSRTLAELALVLALGLPIAYVVTLIIGAPLFLVLRRLGWLSVWTVIAGGALGGLVVGLWYHPPVLTPSVATTLGAVSGAACRWAAQD